MTVKNILIVQFSASRDGSAISGLMLANGFKERGWQTTVVFGHEGPMISEYQMAGHDVLVQKHKNWLRRAQPLRFLKDVLIEWSRAPDFLRLIESLHPDVVYINSAVSLSAAVAARRSKVPLVWHLRELFDELGGDLAVPAILKATVRSIFARFPKQVIVNSSAVAKNLLGKKAKIAEIVPNAVDDKFFQLTLSKQKACERLRLNSSQFVIGVPGTLRPLKGHTFFFKAAAIVCREYPDVCLAITGDGEDSHKQVLLRCVNVLGLERNTEFLGTLDGLDQFYPACDLVCVPSESESFGRVIIEAMASGKAVIASEVGGIPEIIDNGETGLLVTYGDTDALATALIRVITDYKLRESLATSGRARALESFQINTYQQSVLSIVESLE